MSREPEFRIYTGPMFGSKTTRMLAYLERCSHQNRSVIAFKPKMDARYSEGEICTHAGLKFPAINVNSGEDILAAAREHDVIGVDEAFMINGIDEVLISLFFKGANIVVSTIQLDANERPFENIKNIMPFALQYLINFLCTSTSSSSFLSMSS